MGGVGRRDRAEEKKERLAFAARGEDYDITKHIPRKKKRRKTKTDEKLLSSHSQTTARRLGLWK